jgi:hypothetical protein
MIDSYLGPPMPPKLRLKEGDVKSGPHGGDVLDGHFSVEEALLRSVFQARRAGVGYLNVGLYDPVLRAHCRLDREG